MKVKELIEKLRGCDPELDVFLSINDDGMEGQHFDIATVEHWAEGEEYDHIHLYNGALVSG